MVRDRSATKAKATNLRILVSHLLLVPRPSECFSECFTGVDISFNTKTPQAVFDWQIFACDSRVSSPVTRRSARTGKRAVA